MTLPAAVSALVRTWILANPTTECRDESRAALAADMTAELVAATIIKTPKQVSMMIRNLLQKYRPVMQVSYANLEKRSCRSSRDQRLSRDCFKNAGWPFVSVS